MTRDSGDEELEWRINSLGTWERKESKDENVDTSIKDGSSGKGGKIGH